MVMSEGKRVALFFLYILYLEKEGGGGERGKRDKSNRRKRPFMHTHSQQCPTSITTPTGNGPHLMALDFCMCSKVFVMIILIIMKFIAAMYRSRQTFTDLDKQHKG